MGDAAPLSGPDLEAGVPAGDLKTSLLGHVRGEAVVLVRDGKQLHAVGATCTHYSGPLAEGIVANGAIHCPWHHACFDLATGMPHGPALSPIACYDVALDGGTIRVGAKRTVTAAPATGPASVVVVGAGAAGVACVETLRQEGYGGSITLVNGEGSDPVDRPNLSKDYLAGAAPEEWVYLRSADALAAIDVTVVAEPAISIDRGAKRVRIENGNDLAYDALVIATGAEPIRLPLSGAQLPHVHTLRTLADSRSIAAAKSPVVIIGASFIGLEAAASLRARGIDVTVVGPEAVPLARALGDEVGAFIKRVHESKGVAFRLGRTPAKIAADRVVLDDGSELPATLVVMGVGVKPRTELAATAGLTIDRGVVVDADLRAAPNIWAAGDIARHPSAGETVRIEHWQVAVRQGQAVARSILGMPRRIDVPFFWSQHHDVTLGYVGHAERFDRPVIHGDLDAHDAHVVYCEGGMVKAVVGIGRDRLLLEVEAAMETGDHAAINKLVG